MVQKIQTPNVLRLLRKHKELKVLGTGVRGGKGGTMGWVGEESKGGEI